MDRWTAARRPQKPSRRQGRACLPRVCGADVGATWPEPRGREAWSRTAAERLRLIRHRGTFKEDTEYAAYDAVALNGGSFLALRNKPGACPGLGWQLLAAPGKRGTSSEP